MNKNNLPNNIAVFPLSDAVFFPNTVLPLNIFEDRYIKLINDCMKQERMFGMIQPKDKLNKDPEVYQVGCLGKIISFNETRDKRFMINLSGIIRFRVKKEINNKKLYREFNVDYSDFLQDLKSNKIENVHCDKNYLIEKIKIFFKKINYSVSIDELQKLNIDELISTICMISPFAKEEKQKLIETIKIEEKFKILDEIISFNIFDLQESKTLQ
jgi:Lon protease-like protein